MKILYWNIQGGVNTEGILNFLNKNREIDIFCFQEVFDNGKCSRNVFEGSNMSLFNELKCNLKKCDGYFSEHQTDEEGIAIFFRKELRIMETGNVFVHRYKNSMLNNDGEEFGRNLQYIRFNFKNKNYFILNFHGLWDKRGKIDTDERIMQSKNIINVLKRFPKDRLILGGDFNLVPENKSLRIFENFGLINLISKFGITSTRSEKYLKEIRFADYVFVSKSVKVLDFKVLDDWSSDHLPLLLKFE